MKKTLLYLAGAAALLAGCAKEVSVEDLTPGQKTITIQASIDPETRTTVEINGNKGVYSWKANERICVFEANTSTLGAVPRSFQVMDTENGLFEGPIVDGYTLVGALSPVVVDGVGFDETQGEVEFGISMPGTYRYEEDSHAIMVAGAPTVSNNMQKFSFKHAAALFKVTYENVPVGTKKLSITTDQPMAMDQDVSPSCVMFTGFENVEIKTSDIPSSNALKTIYVTFDNAVTTANQTFTFYAPIPTGTYGSVSVALIDAAGNVIEGTTKSKNKEFLVERGNIVALPTIKLAPAPEEKYYVKVTSNDDLMNDGQYLIVYEMGATGLAFDGSLEALDAVSNDIEVEISDNKIVSTEDIDASAFTINIDEGTVLSASGLYVGVNGYSNGLATSETSDYSHEISIDEDENAVLGLVFSGGTMTLRYNKASNQDRFRYYKSGQEPVTLYLLEGTGTTPKPSAELAFNLTSVELTYGDEFTAPEFSNPYGVPVTFTSSNETVATVDADGVVDILAVGNTTITATFAGDDTYKAGSVSYTIAVLAPPTKVSDVIEGGAGNYTLNGVTVFAASAPNYIIGDETGRMVLYKSNLSLTPGAVINVSGPVVDFNGMLEFNSDATVEDTGETVTVDHGTASNPSASVLSVLQDGYHSAIYVEGAGIQSGRNITVGDVTLYINPANGATDNNAVVFRGYVVAYSSNYGTYTFYQTSLAVDATVATLGVSPTALTWEADAYGSSSAKTVSVTLNDAASGYDVEFDDPARAWSVEDDGEGVITVYPVGENESTEDEKTLEITITHSDDASLSKTVTLTQAVSGGVTYGWIETAITDIPNGASVIIVDATSKRAMSNDKGTTNPPAAVSVTITDGEITSDVTDNLKWVITVDSGSYKFGVGSNYLYCTATNNGVRVGTNTNNVFQFVVADHNSEEYFLFNTATSRYLGVYNNQDWRCYDNVNNNIKAVVTKFFVYREK